MTHNIKSISDTDFEKEVINSKNPVVIDFWAPRCWPCKMMEPIIDSLATKYDEKVKFVKLNVDENPKTAIQYGIRWIPTIIIMNKWWIVEQKVWIASPDEYSKILDTVV